MPQVWQRPVFTRADFRLATVKPLFSPFALPNLGPGSVLCEARCFGGWTQYYSRGVRDC